MKIDDRVSNYLALLNSETGKPAEQSDEVSGPRRGVKTLSDAVALSVTAIQMAEDEARRERLNVIRQQLAEGSYNISGKDVAGKILTVLKG